MLLGGPVCVLVAVLLLLVVQGRVIVQGADEDTVFEAAIDAGADDVAPVFDEEGLSTSDFKVRSRVRYEGQETGMTTLCRGGWVGKHVKLSWLMLVGETPAMYLISCC